MLGWELQFDAGRWILGVDVGGEHCSSDGICSLKFRLVYPREDIASCFKETQQCAVMYSMIFISFGICER